MSNTRPHTHYCPYCEEHVECETAARDDVGCIFPSTDAITCDPCAAKVAERMEAKDA